MGVLDVFSSSKATNLDFTKERHSPVPYPSSLLSSTAWPTAPPGAGSPRSEDQNPSAQSPAAAPTSHRLPSQQPSDWPLCFSKSPFKSHHDCPELGPQTASLGLNFPGNRLQTLYHTNLWVILCGSPPLSPTPTLFSTVFYVAGCVDCLPLPIALTSSWLPLWLWHSCTRLFSGVRRGGGGGKGGWGCWGGVSSTE